MITNWQKPFFKEMEKRAFIGNVFMGGMEAMNAMSNIKLNKAKVKLAPPGQFDITHGRDPYSHQFQSNMQTTPGRSLYA